MLKQSAPPEAPATEEQLASLGRTFESRGRRHQRRLLRARREFAPGSEPVREDRAAVRDQAPLDVSRRSADGRAVRTPPGHAQGRTIRWCCSAKGGMASPCFWFTTPTARQCFTAAWRMPSIPRTPSMACSLLATRITRFCTRDLKRWRKFTSVTSERSSRGGRTFWAACVPAVSLPLRSRVNCSGRAKRSRWSPSSMRPMSPPGKPRCELPGRGSIALHRLLSKERQHRRDDMPDRYQNGARKAGNLTRYVFQSRTEAVRNGVAHATISGLPGLLPSRHRDSCKTFPCVPLICSPGSRTAPEPGRWGAVTALATSGTGIDEPFRNRYSGALDGLGSARDRDGAFVRCAWRPLQHAPGAACSCGRAKICSPILTRL